MLGESSGLIFPSINKHGVLSVLRNSSVACRAEPALVHRASYSLLKRLFDVFGGFIGLTALVIIFIPVAVSVRLESPGPVFSRQVSCGLMGKIFTVYKFRTTMASPDTLGHPIRDAEFSYFLKETRFTRVGRFLSSTGIDDLPQFWNVLIGDMSLVGTRLPTIDEVQSYTTRHWKLLSVKPGLTGQWRVFGHSRIKDFEQLVELDLSYQKLWTPWYDLMLIARTLLALPFKARDIR